MSETMLERLKRFVVKFDQLYDPGLICRDDGMVEYGIWKALGFQRDELGDIDLDETVQKPDLANSGRLMKFFELQLDDYGHIVFHGPFDTGDMIERAILGGTFAKTVREFKEGDAESLIIKGEIVVPASPWPEEHVVANEKDPSSQATPTSTQPEVVEVTEYVLTSGAVKGNQSGAALNVAVPLGSKWDLVSSTTSTAEDLTTIFWTWKRSNKKVNDGI